MNFLSIISGVAKLTVICFWICVLLLASNQHGKAWKGSINFWTVLGITAANFFVLAVGGFFNGFLNFCA